MHFNEIIKKITTATTITKNERKKNQIAQVVDLCVHDHDDSIIVYSGLFRLDLVALQPAPFLRSLIMTIKMKFLNEFTKRCDAFRYVAFDLNERQQQQKI